MGSKNNRRGNTAISAVVPVYNMEKYLEDCLISIAKQRVPFYEVILVNDGSTDQSERICKKYCEQYKIFRLVSQKNAGLAEARNVGIRLARGDYIVFIDSDDMVRADMTLCMENALENNEYDAVFYNSAVLYEDREGEPLNYFVRDRQFYGREMSGYDYLSESFPKNYIISACMAVYCLQFIRDQGIYFPKGIYFEDNVFCLQTYIMAKKIKCINEALYIRRCRTGSIMSDLNSYRKCQDLIKVNGAVCDVLKNSKINALLQVHVVSYYFISTWKRLRESDFRDALTDEWNSFLITFHDNWLDKYWTEDMELGDLLTLCIYYNKFRENYLLELKQIRSRIEQELVRKIKGLPLSNPNQTVGIYGIGRHTERMLGLYQKYVGNINKNLFFIVTKNPGKQSEYEGHPLITCDRIPMDAERIIISSLTYKNDMLEQLKRVGISEEIIYELYADNEYCDLLTITDILGLDENSFD